MAHFDCAHEIDTEHCIRRACVIQVLEQDGPIRFTFLWTEENRWEGKDYQVEIIAEQ